MKQVGTQFIIEYYECDVGILSKVSSVEDAMVVAAEKGNANIVGKMFKQFDPWGVSGVLVVSESHVSIHTWPEYGYAAVDVFTCGTEMDCLAIKDALKELLKAKRDETLILERPHLKCLTKSVESLD